MEFYRKENTMKCLSVTLRHASLCTVPSFTHFTASCQWMGMGPSHSLLSFSFFINFFFKNLIIVRGQSDTSLSTPLSHPFLPTCHHFVFDHLIGLPRVNFHAFPLSYNLKLKINFLNSITKKKQNHASSNFIPICDYCTNYILWD